MKKLAVILSMIFVLSATASAQWYLFPGKKQQQEDPPRQQETPAPKFPQTHHKAPAEDVRTVAPPMPEDSVLNEVPGMATDDFVLDLPETIDVTLLLPLKSAGKPSANFYEFYTGALLAAADLGRSGQSINIHVYDTDNPSVPIPQSVLDASDIIIGPISASDIKSTLAKCKNDVTIISPLEPKAAALADSNRVVHLPVPWETQVDDLLAWLRRDMSRLDRIVAVADDDLSRMGEFANKVLLGLDELGLEYTTIHSSKVNDVQLATGNTRFIIAADNEDFLCKATNNIGNLANRTSGVYLYGPSKLRSYDSIHSESLYRASARLTSNYFVDYTDPKVRDFVLRFRALYESEPSSFAFHGYDTMHYFVSICALYGRQWYKKIEEYTENGLQTNFKFKRNGNKGAKNVAVRRIIYNPDLSTTLQ